jgi:hypothetical protein
VCGFPAQQLVHVIDGFIQPREHDAQPVIFLGGDNLACFAHLLEIADEQPPRGLAMPHAGLAQILLVARQRHVLDDLDHFVECRVPCNGFERLVAPARRVLQA